MTTRPAKATTARLAGLSFGPQTAEPDDDDVVDEAPAPPPAPPRAKRASRTKGRPKSPTPKSPKSVAAVRPVTGEWPPVALPHVEMDADVADDVALVKESLNLPKEFTRVLRRAKNRFDTANEDWVDERGTTGVAAFHEGLLRVGLKHVDDPDLIRLIPMDQRGSHGPSDWSSAPPGLPPAKPGSGSEVIEPLDWADSMEGEREKTTMRLSESLVAAIGMALMGWAMAHPQWIAAARRPPGAVAFREGLLRLGVKHVNDPDLRRAIPRDRRRRDS